MERVEFVRLGAFCVKRMSLKGQKEMLSLAESGIPFTGAVLSELRGINGGEDFIAACGKRLGISDFMDILTCCDQPVIDRIIAANEQMVREGTGLEGRN